MGYYYGYDEEDYEPDEEEEYEAMESTDVKGVGEKLVIQFNAENFAQGIVAAVVSQLKEKVYNDVLEKVKEDIFGSMKEQIMLSTHEIVKDIVVDFMENEKVVVGNGSVWDETEKKELTLTQYAKQCIKECIEEGRFKVFKGCEKKRYGSGYELKYNEYAFGEYIAQNLGIGNEAKAYFDEQIDIMRKQVNADVKNAFDESTRTMLSQAVLQVLMANDTYRKIENNIACIADKGKAED